MRFAGKSGNVIIMGNCNYPDVDWTNGNSRLARAGNFINTLRDHFMGKWLKHQPGRKNALVDLFITRILGGGMGRHGGGV